MERESDRMWVVGRYLKCKGIKMITGRELLIYKWMSDPL